MEQRTGVVAIIVSNVGSVPSVQATLSNHSQVIVGRMGVPSHDDSPNVIALIVKGSVEAISALTGALGRISGVQAKSVLAKE